jgi:FOG: HEAT repeat
VLIKTATAPTLGGKTAILAEFDRASRAEEFQRALPKVLRCRDNLVPDLLDRLSSADIPTAKKAAIALGYLRSPQALLPLVKSACDQRRQIHWQATAAIAQIGTPDAVAYLIQLLKYPASVQLQASAAKALGKCGVMAILP